MNNPYKIQGPALISFSGGRTSGFMLKTSKINNLSYLQMMKALIVFVMIKGASNV